MTKKNKDILDDIIENEVWEIVEIIESDLLLDSVLEDIYFFANGNKTKMKQAIKIVVDRKIQEMSIRD